MCPGVNMWIHNRTKTTKQTRWARRREDSRRQNNENRGKTDRNWNDGGKDQDNRSKQIKTEMVTEQTTTTKTKQIETTETKQQHLYENKSSRAKHKETRTRK
jgi:3-oxoacyl-ACP reductase-like protein